MYGNQTKKINKQFNKTININVSTLKPGIYNCHVITERGLENKKKIIKR